MSTIALTFMVTTYTVVTVATIYFFVKVLKTPNKPEPDSFEDNDPK